MTSFNPDMPIPGNFPMPGGRLPIPGEGQLPNPGFPIPGGSLPGGGRLPIPQQPPADFDPTQFDDVLDFLDRYQPNPDQFPPYVNDLLERYRDQLEDLERFRDWRDWFDRFNNDDDDAGNGGDGGLVEPDPIDSFDTTVTIDGDTHSVPSETQALTNSFLVNSNQFTHSTDLDGNGNALVQQTDMTVQTSHWAETFAVNRVARAGSAGDYIQGKQLVYQMGEINNNSAVVSFERAGSILQGSDASDTIRGLAGTDIIDAKGGDDLVHGGNAADVISGGSGADELHGDFGKNTYLDQADGSVDLIAIKSDQHLHNWWIGSDGNNANGQKADVIERLDANDQIKIIGAATEDLAFRQASIHGLSGIGIFADGSLEAIYTGGDLSAQQLQSMTTGDASNAAMNNQIWSYNFGNETPPVI
jgi:hypothetical protein